jgi:hypothetical protein
VNILTVRANEGAQSLIRRARTKLLTTELEAFNLELGQIDVHDKAAVLEVISKFYKLEYK